MGEAVATFTGATGGLDEVVFAATMTVRFEEVSAPGSRVTGGLE